MEFHFRYNGPKSETKVRGCALCDTAARGVCVLEELPKIEGDMPVPHEDAAVVGCAHCDAARNGFCPSHCGIEKALAAHAPHETDPENCQWKDYGVIQRSGGKGGIVRKREETPHSEEKQARIDKACAQFAGVAAYVRTYCAKMPECVVDVNLRADDFEKCGSMHIEILAVPLQE